MYHLITLLQQNKMVASLEVIRFIQEEEDQFFYAKATLSNGSILFARESLTKKGRGYSYQWQTKNNNLIARWDNAPHHHNINTFPHHKHKKSHKNVMPSKIISLSAVLKIIENKI